MPQFVENCVRSILADKNFKPQKGRTKEESAWAICNAKYNEIEAQANALKKRAKKP